MSDWLAFLASVLTNWNAVAAIAAAVSAGFAAAQIRQARTESIRRSTFEYLKEIEVRLRAIMTEPSASLRDGVAEKYRLRLALTEKECEYLAVLNMLDIVALAREKRVVDRKVVDEYLKTVVRPELVSLSSVNALRSTWQDDCIYEHLCRWLLELQTTRRDSRRLRNE